MNSQNHPGFRTVYASSYNFMNLPQSSGKRTFERDFPASGSMDAQSREKYNSARIQFRSQAQLPDASLQKESAYRGVETLPSLNEPGSVSNKTGLLLSLKNLAPGGKSRQLYQDSVNAVSSMANTKNSKPHYKAMMVKAPSHEEALTPKAPSYEALTPRAPSHEALTPRAPSPRRAPRGAGERPASLRRGYSVAAVTQEKGLNKVDSGAETEMGSDTYTLRPGVGICQGFNSTWPASTSFLEKLPINPHSVGTPIRSGKFKNTKFIQGVAFF